MFVIEERGKELVLDGVEIGWFDSIEEATEALREYIDEEGAINLQNVTFDIVERIVVKRYKVHMDISLRELQHD